MGGHGFGPDELGGPLSSSDSRNSEDSCRAITATPCPPPTLEGVPPAETRGWGRPPHEPSTLGRLVQEVVLQPKAVQLTSVMLAQKAKLDQWNSSLGIAKQSGSEPWGQKSKGCVQSCNEAMAEAFQEPRDEEAGLIWKGRWLCRENDGAELQGGEVPP